MTTSVSQNTITNLKIGHRSRRVLIADTTPLRSTPKRAFTGIRLKARVE